MIQMLSDYLSFENEIIEEKPWKWVKKTFLKKPLLHGLLILLSGGYHLYSLKRRAHRFIRNAQAARKVIFCIQAQQKIEMIKNCESCRDKVLEKAKKERIGIHRLDEIYSDDELLKLTHHPIQEETFLSSTYFAQKPSEAWKTLQKESAFPRDIDRINIYYEELKKKRALTHEDVLQLIDGKIQGRRTSIVALEVLDDVFQELLDDVL
ncbi:MAG: hypothetical protein AB7N99_03800 [Simkaniaceae bacterium]